MNLKLAQKWYDSKEYRDKLKQRVENLIEAKADIPKAKLLYASDPIRFIEDFGWLKIPNFGNAIKPFFMFDYQKEVIHRIREAEDDFNPHEILSDKPREMGLTWLIVYYMYWRWLFFPNWSGFVLSRTETEVDDGSTLPDSSIFGKLRWVMANTPRWLMPDGFVPKGKKGTNTDMTLRLVNPALGSSINGSSTNSNAGRSRRYSFTFVDECFYIENFLQVIASLESVSKTKVFVSSAKMGRSYNDFVKSIEKKGDYISLTWQDHPWKDLEWYHDLEIKAEFNPEVMREAVVSYALDAKSQYYPEITKSRIDPIAYDRKRPLYVGLDVGRSDMTVLIWFQFTGLDYNILECYANKNRDIEWYAPFLNPALSYNPEKYSPYQKELINKLRAWQKPVAYFGEEAHNHKVMPLNRSIVQEFFKYGVKLRWNVNAIQHEPRRHATSQLLPRMVFNKDSPYVMTLYDAVSNSRYANSVTSKEAAKKPVHDLEISDYRSALENFCVCIPLVLRHQRTEIAYQGEEKSAISALIKRMKI